MSPRVRVAVLAGGRSSEHEISVASARSVLESLDPDRYEAVTVEIDREGKWQLESGESRALDPGAAGERDEGEGRTVVETLPVSRRQQFIVRDIGRESISGAAA